MDMQNKKKVIPLLVSLVMAVGLALVVYADSDSLTVQTTGVNGDPNIDTCVVDNTVFNPTENSVTAVTVRFNVTDGNGASDLNDSLAKAEFDNNETAFEALYESAANTSCVSSDIDADTRQYTCSVSMQFWFQHSQNYSVRCYAGDNNDSALVSSTALNAFDYTKLVASSVDGTTVNFGTITSSQFGTTVNDTNSPVNITNTGNAVLANISITGANLTQAGKPDIDIGQFSADDVSTYNSSTAQTLTTSNQQITGVSVPLEDSTQGGNDDSLWAFFTVPGTLEPGSYSGTWTLFEQE